jgi:hypothetical protein
MTLRRGFKTSKRYSTGKSLRLPTSDTKFDGATGLQQVHTGPEPSTISGVKNIHSVNRLQTRK